LRLRMRWILGDRFLWGIAAALSLLGLLVVYSATVSLIFRHHPGFPEYYLLKHFLTLLIAFVGAYAIHHTDYRRWGPILEVSWWVSLLLSGYVFFRGGGSRWLYIGGVSFQPSELARFSLIGMLAYRIAREPQILSSWESLWPLLMRIGVTFLLIAPHNLSGGLLLLLTIIPFLYIAGLSVGKMSRLFFLGLLLVGLLFLIAPRSKVWQSRILSYLKGETLVSSSVGDDYQRAHASIAVFSGGIVGKGPGRSTQRYYLPQSYSDFAYSILVEEYGLIGGLVTWGLYTLYFWRLAALASMVEGFARLFLIGFLLHGLMQVIIHIGVNIEVFPITGVPLPWISLGGSSLFIQAIGLGIALGISRRVL
jgi:cell division protein FtsW